MAPSKDANGEEYQMETEEEINPETNSEADENLTGDAVEIDLEDDDLTELLGLEEEEEEENIDAHIEAAEIVELPELEEVDLEHFEDDELNDETVATEDSILEEDFLHKFTEDDLSPLSFARTQVVIFAVEKVQAELLQRYLSERAGMEVDCVSKRQNLWRLLKLDPMDLVIFETGSVENSDALEVMQQTKDQFPEVHFICISGPVSLERRLQFLNAGALDYLTRPVHLSTVAQSVLVQLSRTDTYENEEELVDLDSVADDIPVEETLVDSADTYHDEDLSGTEGLQGDDLILGDEIDLVDEDF
ncbi:MAG: response regulator [SAR324 cluster bacterium]|nr:response regulator [SAR324 cluster bacterium]